ncbi:MAG: CpsB/CapC family capsule biosynthesis tyrosine phosphatase [Polyangia bacterium]
MSGYVDLHAHYLFAVDDGADDLAVAQQMVNCVIDLGFSELYATPHQRSGLFLPSRPDIDAARASLNEVLRVQGSAPLGLGFENFWDDVLLQRIGERAIPSYDDGPAFLFEVTPQLMPSGIEDTLFALRIQGKLPVMAHPERYLAVQNHLQRAEALGRSAALVVDLGALDGAHGRAEMRTARQLLQEGLVHAAATDIHRADDARSIGAGIAWIRKHLGERALQTLLAENPRQILEGELPQPWR